MEIKYELYQHQKECLDYSKKKNKFILADGMGLGKTLQGICVAIDKKSEVKHCLIVCCVNGMQYSWKHEIENATYESARILGDRLGKKTKKWSIKGNKEKLEDLNNLGEEYFIITNIEVFRNKDMVDKITTLCKKGIIGMCIIDEPHLGCLSGDTLIDTTEGKIPIRDIVNSNKDYCVYAIDSNGDIVPRHITERHVSQQPTNLIELCIEENGKIYTIKCTPNHPIRTRNRGYIPAEYIDENDDIVVEDMVYGKENM